MLITDQKYTEKKLSQVGYYRLSGFWHIARKPNKHNSSLSDEFLDGVRFDEVYKLYLFDKKLRLLFIDIIERIEINIRTIMAHELGKNNPLTYEDHNVINPKCLKHQWKGVSYPFAKWQDSVSTKILRCNDDFIEWHKGNNNPLPFWVITETWDFGTMSKYYSLLKGEYQKKIAKCFNIDENTLNSWLREINILRNLSAHHSRIWNKSFSAIAIPNFDNPKLGKFKKAKSYFDNITLTDYSRSRLFGRIVILWYLVNQTSTNYKWLEKINEVIREFPDVPNAKLKAMGLEDYGEIPIELMKSL